MPREPQSLTDDDIKVGTIWEAKTGRWKVIAERYDGPGTYRVVRLNPDGSPSQLYDTVWAAEILKEARYAA